MLPVHRFSRAFSFKPRFHHPTVALRFSEAQNCSVDAFCSEAPFPVAPPSPKPSRVSARPHLGLTWKPSLTWPQITSRTISRHKSTGGSVNRSRPATGRLPPHQALRESRPHVPMRARGPEDGARTADLGAEGSSVHPRPAAVGATGDTPRGTAESCGCHHRAAAGAPPAHIPPRHREELASAPSVWAAGKDRDASMRGPCRPPAFRVGAASLPREGTPRNWGFPDAEQGGAGGGRQAEVTA